MGRAKALSALFKAGSEILPARSGVDKPRALTLFKSRPGGSPKVLNIITRGNAKVFLCLSKLEVKFFQREAVRSNKGHLRFLRQNK
jgi:hypothetical protein